MEDEVAEIRRLDGTIVERPPAQRNEEIAADLHDISETNEAGRATAFAGVVLTTDGYNNYWSVSDEHQPHSKHEAFSLIGALHHLISRIEHDIDYNSRDVNIPDEDEPA